MPFTCPLPVVIFLLSFLHGSTADTMPCRNDSKLAESYLSREATIQCGLANQGQRIVSGSVAQPNEFPWLAHLTVYFWSGGAATCGGTVIGDKWILTAAHCTYGAVNITVTLGAHDVSVAELQQQKFLAKSATLHPLWKFGDVENDVALIELPQPAVLSDYVRPACLPFSDDPDQVGDPVTLTGWGNYSTEADSGLSPVPRRVLTYVISSLGTDGQCQQLSNIGSFSGDKVICGDGSTGRRFCYGDDGGPMNYYNSYWGTYTVVGVAWMGDSSVNCQSSRLPSIYARVSHYVDWIYNNTDIQPTTTTTTSSSGGTEANSPTTQQSMTSTTTRSSSGSGLDCRGKPNGVYANPDDDCSTVFYKCSNGYAYEYSCPDPGTVFNPELCDCDFPSNVPACGVAT